MNVDGDNLLDKIAARLRMEAVPEMPVELASSKKRGNPAWVWYGLAAGALAASMAATTAWGPRQNEQKGEPRVAEQSRAKTDSSVVRQVVDFAAPLTEIESKLDGLDEEIRELKAKAALVDARKKADELLARF